MRGDKVCSKYAHLAKDDDAGKVQLDVGLPEQTGQHGHEIRETQLRSDDFLHLEEWRNKRLEGTPYSTSIHYIVDGEIKERRN